MKSDGAMRDMELTAAELGEAELEAWERVLSNQEVRGLLYSAKDGQWYVDSRVQGGVMRSTMVFGRISLGSDEFDWIPVPSKVIDAFGIGNQEDEIISRETTVVDWREAAPSAEELNFDSLFDREGNRMVSAICIDAESGEVVMEGYK